MHDSLMHENLFEPTHFAVVLIYVQYSYFLSLSKKNVTLWSFCSFCLALFRVKKLTVSAMTPIPT